MEESMRHSFLSSITCAIAFLVASTNTVAAPQLRAAFVEQCAVSLKTSTLPASPRHEGTALGATLLTSAANVLLDAGLDYIKVQLDPTQNEYADSTAIVSNGLFNAAEHNSALNCVMIAIFDTDEKSAPKMPITEIKGTGAKDPFKGITVAADRIAAVFPGGGSPVIYLEAVRVLSPDSTAHYYQPVYAFVGKMVRPHWLSNEPAWQITMAWQSPDKETPMATWSYKFAGNPPFERTEAQLLPYLRGWAPLVLADKNTPKNNESRPFTAKVDIAEHRKATLLSKALSKAVSENEVALKTAARDVYPWRKAEIERQAQVAATTEAVDALERVSTYLTALAAYDTGCTQVVVVGTAHAKCQLQYVNLKAQGLARTKDVTNYKLLDGAALPQPSKPKDS